MRRIQPAPQHCDSCNTPYPSVPVWGWQVHQREGDQSYNRHPNVSHYRLCPECAENLPSHTKCSERRAVPFVWRSSAQPCGREKTGHLLRRSRRQSGLITRIRQVQLLSPLPSAGQVFDLAAPPRSPDLVGRLFFAALEPPCLTAGSLSAASAPRVAGQSTRYQRRPRAARRAPGLLREVTR